MGIKIDADEITRHLKIDARKALTDEQWDAYCKLNDQEIISEATLLARPDGGCLWSTTLIKKYLRPFSLGAGYPVSALGSVQGYGKSKNRYRRSDVAKAWAAIPAKIRDDRESILRGY